MLYVPRRAQEQCFGARALDGKLEGLGDAPPSASPGSQVCASAAGKRLVEGCSCVFSLPEGICSLCIHSIAL